MPIAMGVLSNTFQIFCARCLEKWAYLNSSAIIALSPTMKNGIVKAGYPSHKVAVIPNGCDITEFNPDIDKKNKFRTDRPWINNRPLLIYAGTFGHVNGLDYMIKLARHLKDLSSNISILLVGDGAQRDSLHKLAASYGVLDYNLFIEGYMPKSEVPSLFSAATCSSSLFLDLPEMRANSANKFFDGLASGKPIFLNYGGWMHDLVVKYKCGFSAWGIPIHQTAVQLDFFLNDEAWLDSAGQSSRKLAEHYFSRDSLVSQLESVLSTISINPSSPVDLIAPGNYDKF